MTNLEIILTVAVWSLVACVFFHYRSLAIKQQREPDSSVRHDTQPIGDGRL